MSTKILFTMAFTVLLSLMLVPTASAGDCCDDDWDWFEVEYTELDYRAMGFLWESWLIPEAGKVAILPFTDFSDQSIIDTHYGGGETPAGRRIAEMLGFQFTRLGLIPIPYDDGYGAFQMLAAERKDQRKSESQFNNFYHMDNKSKLLGGAIKDWAPGVLTSMRRPGEGMYLSREEIVHLGEMVGADLIIRGSLSEYGMQRKIEGNWRTFLPPFLGMMNKEKEGMIEATIYMYDAHSGELVWVAYEEIEIQPSLPLFQTNFEVMDDAEARIALKLISHLVPEPLEEGASPCPGRAGH